MRGVRKEFMDNSIKIIIFTINYNRNLSAVNSIRKKLNKILFKKSKKFKIQNKNQNI